MKTKMQIFLAVLGVVLMAYSFLTVYYAAVLWETEMEGVSQWLVVSTVAGFSGGLTLIITGLGWAIWQSINDKSN